MSRKKETSPLAVAFGSSVRSLRKEAGYNQEAFAHVCGIDRAYFGLIERGGHTPTITTVWKIADALEIAPSDLVIATENEVAAAKGGKKLPKTHALPKPKSSRQVGKSGKGGGKN